MIGAWALAAALGVTIVNGVLCLVHGDTQGAAIFAILAWCIKEDI